jgi:mannose-6-phosphate isomerase-like protein (cupin superfamily)
MQCHKSFRKWPGVAVATHAYAKLSGPKLLRFQPTNKKKRNPIKRKISICVKYILWYTKWAKPFHLRLGIKLKTLLLLVFLSSSLSGQERKVDPTWLHRYAPDLSEARTDPASPGCHDKPIFGEGDSESRSLVSVARFDEVTIDARSNCLSTTYDRQEEIYFVLKGQGNLHYSDKTYPLRANDFTYLPPGVKHSVANSSDRALQVLVMGFKIPSAILIGAPSSEPKIVNLDNVKEETVEGHPTSVLYKLLIGPRTGTRDAMDDAYVVTSLFWMDFAPGGTNFPHHHETAEEIYLVLDGEGVMVAGGGMDGIEGRHPAKAGDAYYFRQNCTVGFYNQNKPGAKAYILAVRSRIPLPKDDD